MAELDLEQESETEEVAGEQETPKSEQALLGNANIADMAAQERAGREMTRDQALQVIRSSPAVAMPHRAALEQRFGAGLDQVRVHTGPDVSAALRAIGAEALTIGQDIAFADELPSVELMAHELTHVVQQRAGKQQGEEKDEAEAESVEQGGAPPTEHLPEDAIKPGGPGPEVRFKKAVAEELDPKSLDKEGADLGQKDLNAAQIAKAIAYNDHKWQGGQRDQLLGYLRGAGAPGGGFTEGDVEKVARMQRGAGIAATGCDGMIGDTTMAILLHAGFAFEFDDKVKVKPSDVQLLFYPGEFEDLEAWKAAAQQATKEGEGDPSFNVYRATSKLAPPGTGRMYVKWKGSIVDTIDCRGGPPISLRDGAKHTADPSKSGTYNLGAGQAVKTSSWYMSQIRWGSKFRERDDGEIEFQEPGAAKWVVASGPKSELKEPMQRSDFYDSGGLMKEWRGNDFGERAYQIQNSPGMFIHTTPNDEETVLAGGTPVLAHSHGCLHVNPAERQRLEHEGFLQGGVQLVIKKYDVHLIPDHMREEMKDKAEE